MTPTVFRSGRYRFFFYSREESRPHVHVVTPDGEAKFWLEPTVSLADYVGFKDRELNKLQQIVERRKNEFKEAWEKYFGV